MKWFFVLLLAIPEWLAIAWALMVFLGVLHHELSPAIPALGYTSMLPIAAATTLVSSVWALFHGIAKGILE